jgi:hypothetical protein
MFIHALGARHGVSFLIKSVSLFPPPHPTIKPYLFCSEAEVDECA